MTYEMPTADDLSAGVRPSQPPLIHIRPDGSIRISDVDFRRGPKDNTEPVIRNEASVPITAEHCNFGLGGIVNGLWLG